ncbi:NAD(P)-binding protein [Infundibulicybe gibba]|nr:NAD(P)-binding protein [Infundibulicybe gibba]
MATAEAQQAIKKTFVGTPFFAVIGASKDKTKFGTKVLQWYQERSFNVTPVHPVQQIQQKEAELEGLKTLGSLSQLPSPKETAISVITPPKACDKAHQYGYSSLMSFCTKVTLGILEQAKELSIPAIWLQPGAEDPAVIDYIKEHGLADRVIYGGPCILVEGDQIIKSLL